MDRIAGTPFSVPVSVGPLPVDGSVRYTIRDHNGEPFAGFNDVVIPTTATTSMALINVPVELTEIASEFEKRLIDVYWVNQEGPGWKRIPIRLIPDLNLMVQPRDVRNLLGPNETELPDADIDLFTAYLLVKAEYEDIDIALISGGVEELYANQAIATKAALNVLPSLRLRVARQQSDGRVAFQRNKLESLDELRAELENSYTQYVAILTDDFGDEDAVSFFEVVSRPDPFTGA